MQTNQFILVVYDISNDRRRTRLHNLLLDFGTPVQYSVFECLLSPKQEMKMNQRVLKIIKPRLDKVRYYPLCANCVRGVQVTSGKEVLSKDKSAIVV